MNNFLKKICIDFDGTHVEKVDEFPQGTSVFNVPVNTTKILITIVISLKFIGIKYATITQHIGLI